MRIVPTFLLVAAFGTAAQNSSVTRPTPFGFSAGETREQILADAKDATIATDADGILVLTSAPKPNADFRAYVLHISKTNGLARVIAVSKPIPVSDGSGAELTARYEATRNALAEKYGPPQTDIDYLQKDSPWDGYRYRMQSLLDNDRTIGASWTIKGADTNIVLDVHAESENVGDLMLTYVFVSEDLAWSKEHQNKPKVDNSTF